jgi:hypothetical protein
MPLTEKGRKIMANMKEQYGGEKGERVFYASRNKGVISGVDKGSRKKKKHNEYMRNRRPMPERMNYGRQQYRRKKSNY